MSAPSTEYMHGLNGVSQNTNYLLSNVLVATFFGLMAVTILYRCCTLGNAHIRHIFTMGRFEDSRYWMLNRSRFWPWVKKQIIYAPLLRQRHNREIQLSEAIAIGTLPSRYHMLLLLLYLASNFAYILALNWREESYAIIAELRGRSGQLAALNLIPTFLFALRNNPLSPLLGVSYDTFNLLHRYCARVVVIESIVHTAAWASNTIASGGQAQIRLSLGTSASYSWGMVGTCAFSLMFILAVGPLRHAFYETFLNIHRILAMLGLAGVWVHLAKAGLPQLPYVKLCLMLWLAELFWRFCRVAYHNFSRKHGVTRVTVEALPAEACRVTFDLARPWYWKPGCHVHAYLPAIALWSSHPFSVAWAEDKTPEPPMELEMKKLYFDPPPTKPIDSHRRGTMIRQRSRSRASTMTTVAEKTSDTERKNIAIPRNAGVTSVSLVIRARTGMTRKLYEKAAAAPRGTITTWGAIEGRYGGHESMSSYGTVVLFAGGVGITHCVGYVHHLMLQYQAGISSTQKILLVWSVPNTEALSWVQCWMDQILGMEGRRDVLRIQLFVTKPRHHGEVKSATGSVQMFPGRCNPQTIIQKEMQERIGAMGITVCGPGAFSDSVRSAVRDVVEEGVVDFVEEAFTY